MPHIRNHCLNLQTSAAIYKNDRLLSARSITKEKGNVIQNGNVWYGSHLVVPLRLRQSLLAYLHVSVTTDTTGQVHKC